MSCNGQIVHPEWDLLVQIEKTFILIDKEVWCVILAWRRLMIITTDSRDKSADVRLSVVSVFESIFLYDHFKQRRRRGKIKEIQCMSDVVFLRSCSCSQIAK